MIDTPLIDTALIYAAGRGTRMGALTANKPKPLLELNGRALIDYSREMLEGAGIKNIHVNAAYLSDQIEAHFRGQNIHIHTEPDGPFETGGTLKSLAARLPEKIITLNSDVIYFDENPARTLLAQAQKNQDATLLLVPRENAIGNDGQGDFFWDGQNLTRRGDAPTAPYVYSGMQIIRPRLALDFEPKIFSTNLIWDELIKNNRISAAIYDGRWMDLGNAESLERAREAMQI